MVHSTAGSSMLCLQRVRGDLTWAALCKECYPYYLTTGTNAAATCRGCGLRFQKKDLRIKTTLLYQTRISLRPCEINFCLNLQCVTKGSARYLPWVSANDFTDSDAQANSTVFRKNPTPSRVGDKRHTNSERSGMDIR